MPCVQSPLPAPFVPQVGAASARPAAADPLAMKVQQSERLLLAGDYAAAGNAAADVVLPFLPVESKAVLQQAIDKASSTSGASTTAASAKEKREEAFDAFGTDLPIATAAAALTPLACRAVTVLLQAVVKTHEQQNATATPSAGAASKSFKSRTVSVSSTLSVNDAMTVVPAVLAPPAVRMKQAPHAFADLAIVHTKTLIYLEWQRSKQSAPASGAVVSPPAAPAAAAAFFRPLLEGAVMKFVSGDFADQETDVRAAVDKMVGFYVSTVTGQESAAFLSDYRRELTHVFEAQPSYVDDLTAKAKRAAEARAARDAAAATAKQNAASSATVSPSSGSHTVNFGHSKAATGDALAPPPPAPNATIATRAAPQSLVERIQAALFGSGTSSAGVKAVVGVVIAVLVTVLVRRLVLARVAGAAARAAATAPATAAPARRLTV